MKIERKYLAHYINVSQEGEAVYERLGQDLETFAPEMSAQVETKRNILGESAVVISGYEKTGAVEPYYADTDTGLFARLQTIIDEDLVLEKLKTDVVEVKLWKESDGKYEAIREEAYIAISSYGGDTTGYQIPFTLHYTGKKTKGLFDVATRTFTEA
jgi:hypothetical protein